MDPAPMSKARILRILYLVHDVSDPAVLKRVQMLVEGGAQVVIAGFSRSDKIIAELSNCLVFTLGRSHDSRLIARAFLVMKTFLAPHSNLIRSESFDLIIARNLEMLFIAQRIRITPPKIKKIAYECLDIHRVMLGTGATSIAIRLIERFLMKGCTLLMVSSPAFIDHYFNKVQRIHAKHLLVENKVFLKRSEGQSVPNYSRPREPGTPIRIGWFGMIRCRRSFDFLSSLATDRLIEVIIAGRPSPAIFPDFLDLVRLRPGVTFLGEYGSDDIVKLYGAIDIAWAIDFYEEGKNSDWLLPNRLYESSACGCPVIAIAHTATGHHLQALGIGVLVKDLEAIRDELPSLNTERIEVLSNSVRRLEKEKFVHSPDDSARLIHRLTRLVREFDSETPKLK